MLAATFSGTPGDDTIDIGYDSSADKARVIINGTVNLTLDGLIIVNAHGGNDTITVTDTFLNFNYVVNGEDGDDVLTDPNHELGSAFIRASSFDFDGGPGFDALIADNSNDGLQDARLEIRHDGIIRSGATGSFFQVTPKPINVERLEYLDSASSNRIEFLTHAFEQVVIAGNDGNDLITNVPESNASAQLVPSLASVGMTIAGGGGNDTLSLEDQLTNVDERLVTIGGGTLLAQADDVTSGLLGYGGIELFDFLGNVGSDHIVLRGKSSSMTMSINTQDGDDTLIVGGGDLDSGGFTTANTSIIAGNGVDSIEFDDRLDGIGETEAYTFSPFNLTKGSAGITYSAIESQTLLAADGGVQPFQPSTINLNSFSSQIASTTITGGAHRPNIVNITTGNLNLPGTLALNMGAALDTVNVNDQNATSFPNSYQVASNAFVKTSTGRTIPYSGVDALVLNTSALADAVTVSSVAAGMAVTVNSNAGNDTLSMGNGNIEFNLKGPVVMNGGAGTDTGFYTNTFDNTPATQVLNGLSLTDGGITHSYTGVEALRLNEGPGGTNLTINSTSVQTNVTGNSGDDIVTVGGGDIDANFPSGAAQGLFIDGAGGNDSVLLNDLNDTGVDTYNFQRPNGTDQMIKDAVGVPYYVSWAGIGGVTLDASNAPTSGTSQSPIIVFDIATPLRINGNDGSDWVIVQDSQVPVFVNTGTGINDQVNVNHDLDGVPVTVVVDQNDDVETLNVFAAGTLRITNGATLVKTRAATSPGTLSIVGVLDLAGGSFLSRAGGPTPAAFRNQLIAGRNGGAWNGTSASGVINSSLAAASSTNDSVGYGLGSEIAPTSIAGFNIAAGDTLLRYTLEGDANLDLKVDLTDFTVLAANFNGTAKAWAQADFSYDSKDDLTDFTFLAVNFNQTLPSALPGLAATTSPFAQRRVGENVLPAVAEREA